MKKIFKSVVIFSIIFSISITNPVRAFDEEFFSANDILFYNPDDTGSICSSFNSNVSFNPSVIETQKIIAQFLTSTNFKHNNNKPLNAVQMAAVLGNVNTESQSLNPMSGVAENASHKGIGQWTSPGRWDLIPEPKTDLNSQLQFLASELDNDYYGKNVGNFWNITDYTDLTEATFLIARNYEVGIYFDGGSTEWQDDATALKYIQGWETRRDFAQSIYRNYASIADSSQTCAGMNEEQAIKYMEAYENSDGNNLYAWSNECFNYDSTETDYVGRNKLANCVAVITYFIQNNTNLEHIGLPNGGQVADTLISSGWADGGNTPKPYSVFSHEKHTGLVLAIEDDYILTFEEGCNTRLYKDGGALGIMKRTKSEISSYQFAYPPEGSLVNL